MLDSRNKKQEERTDWFENDIIENLKLELSNSKLLSFQSNGGSAVLISWISVFPSLCFIFL